MVRARRARLSAIAAALVLATAAIADARSATPPSIGAMARSAARVFRGRCAGAVVETTTVGSVPVPVTVYTFEVDEHLKGDARATVTFRQIGTPAGGMRDLGTLVGLPVFAPGTEYVLFLLPEGRAGMTSPAGAGDGAFVVRDGEVASVRGADDPDAAALPVAPMAQARAAVRASGGAGRERRSYQALRRAVLDELAR